MVLLQHTSVLLVKLTERGDWLGGQPTPDKGRFWRDTFLTKLVVVGCCGRRTFVFLGEAPDNFHVHSSLPGLFISFVDDSFACMGNILHVHLLCRETR